LDNYLPKWASNQRSALAQHENILALGIQATDFSGPAIIKSIPTTYPFRASTQIQNNTLNSVKDS